MEKNIVLSILCQIYGKLLTERQLAIMEDYYNNDLSLSEIAENRNITRQAVRDNLIKAEKKLMEFEEKLGLMDKMFNQEQKLARVLRDINNIKNKLADEEDKKILENVKKQISCLI